MKKIVSLLSVLSLTLLFAFANDPQIDAEFDQLNKIEKYVENNDVTLEELQANNSDLVAGIDLNTDAAASIASADLPAGIPAFWWGCVLGILGVILVYVLTDKNQEQSKKALIGCLAWGVVAGLFWIITSATYWF
jgi:hypothetical protein